MKKNNNALNFYITKLIFINFKLEKMNEMTYIIKYKKKKKKRA